MKRTYFSLLGPFVGFAALLYGPSPALAQTAPPLGAVQQFSVLGNSGVTGSTGAGTVVNGHLGSSPTASITNFPPSRVTPPFTLHLTNDLTVQQAHADAKAAYDFLAAQGPGTELPAQLNGEVLTSGIYSFAGGAADLAALGTLTLDGPGIFIFQVESALTANVGSNVIGTANPCDVFWRVGTSATLNGISFRGNVIADASITVGSGANVTGRAITGTGPTGAVTMAGAGGNTIGGCASAAVAGTVGAGGVFPAGTTFLGVPLQGLEVGYGVEIATDGSALGQFSSILLGVAQNIVVYGKASAGSRTAPNIATFSGTATIDDGTSLPLTGVPFTATITMDANDQGSIVLVLGDTTLPAATISQGTMTIK